MRLRTSTLDPNCYLVIFDEKELRRGLLFHRELRAEGCRPGIEGRHMTIPKKDLELLKRVVEKVYSITWIEIS